MNYKHKPLIIVGGVLLLIPALFFGINIKNSSRRYLKTEINTSDVIPFLKDGDVICRLGDRLWSLYFKDLSLSDKRFSHLGIVRIRGENLSIINAEGHTIGKHDSVNEVSLREFLQAAKAVGVYRLKSADGAAVSDAAMEYKGYPFDWDFDLHDETKIYCTELLYVILKRINHDAVLKTAYNNEFAKTILPLESISNSGDFDEVLYIAPSAESIR